MIVDVTTGGVADGQVLFIIHLTPRFQPGNASSAKSMVLIYHLLHRLLIILLMFNRMVDQINIFLGYPQRTLELEEGNTYVFSYPSAHPLLYQQHQDGSHGGGSEYTTGVTRDTSNTLTYVVPTGAPTLYYCTSHSGMGGQANTQLQ